MCQVANVELPRRAALLAFRQQQEGVLAQVREQLLAKGQERDILESPVQVFQDRHRVGGVADLKRDYHRKPAAWPKQPDAMNKEGQPRTAQFAEL